MSTQIKFSVHNNGPNKSTGTRVTFSGLENVTLTNPTVTKGTWESGIWIIGELDIGEQVDFSADAEIIFGTTTTVTARVYSSVTDTNLNNNIHEFDIVKGGSSGGALYITPYESPTLGARVSFTVDNNVHYIDSDGAVTHLVPSENGVYGNSYHVALAGKYLAYKIYDGYVVYDMDTITQHAVLPVTLSFGHSSEIHASPDGKLLGYSYGDNDSSYIVIIDAETLEEVAELSMKSDSINAFVFGEDNQTIYCRDLFERFGPDDLVTEIVEINFITGERRRIRHEEQEYEAFAHFLCVINNRLITTSQGGFSQFDLDTLWREDWWDGGSAYSKTFSIFNDFAIMNLLGRGMVVVYVGDDMATMNETTSTEPIWFPNDAGGMNYHGSHNKDGEVIYFGDIYQQGPPAYAYSLMIGGIQPTLPVVLGEYQNYMMTVFV